MTVDRRDFLKSAVASLLALGLDPRAIARAHAGSKASRRGARRLVLVELEGGNDALATLQPLDSPELRRLRPTLVEPSTRLLHLDDRLGLNPALEPLMTNWKEGRLALLPQIGFHPADRSHFRAMDIWHSAEPEKETTRDGWIGRLASAARDDGRESPTLIHLAGGPTPLLYAGAPSPVLHLTDPEALRLPADIMPLIAESNRETEGTEPEASYLAAATRDALALSRRLGARPLTTRGGSDLESRLELAAGLSSLLPEDLVFYCRLSGFDSHASQRDSQPALLASLARGLAGLDRLFRAEERGELCVLVYSEFGRRIAENANRGTDHGAGGLALLMGARVKGGLVGPGLDLREQEQGDLAPRLDFRALYRGLARDFLDLPAKAIGGEATSLALFR